jgi:hypothetical protein
MARSVLSAAALFSVAVPLVLASPCASAAPAAKPYDFDGNGDRAVGRYTLKRYL